MPHMHHTSNLILKWLSCRSWVTLQKSGFYFVQIPDYFGTIILYRSKLLFIFSYFAVFQRFEATALPGWACWLECVSAQNNRCLSLWKHFCEYKTPTLHNIGTPWLEKNRRPAEGLFLTRSVWACVCLCTDTFVCAFPRFLHRWPPLRYIWDSKCHFYPSKSAF